jgi:hypothetical protein
LYLDSGTSGQHGPKSKGGIANIPLGLDLKNQAIVSAYDKHMRTAQEIPAHVNATFMFLWDCVIEKKRKIQGWANRRKPGFINCPAILRRLFGVRIVIAAPRGSNVC